MTFRDPRMLAMLLVVPIAAWFLFTREAARERLATRFVSSRLRGEFNPVRRARPWLLVSGLLLALLALAGPSVGFTTVAVQAKESNRVIAIDVSLSMAAEDVGTSRLDAAKAIARRLIAAQGGRTGIVAFEGVAEVVAPLTTDDEAVSELVDSLQPGELSEPGSNLGSALDASLRLLASDPTQKGDIVVLSDGEDQDPHFEARIREAKARGIVISTIVIGTTEGTTIPTGGNEPLHDDDGKVVHTSAHGETMQSVAQQTGGAFLSNPFANGALETLPATIGGTAKAHEIHMPIDRFQWPLLAAFLIFVLGSFANRGAE